MQLELLSAAVTLALCQHFDMTGGLHLPLTFPNTVKSLSYETALFGTPIALYIPGSSVIRKETLEQRQCSKWKEISTMKPLSILQWYQILRAHHWTMFQAVQYALWLALNHPATSGQRLAESSTPVPGAHKPPCTLVGQTQTVSGLI